MIYSSLDAHRNDGPTVTTAWGHAVSLDGAQQECERLEDKIDAYRAELSKQHDSATRRRLRSKLERFETEHDVLWRALNPVYSDTEGYASAEFNPGCLQPCRSADCTNQLTKQLAFQTTGFCPPCWAKASGKAASC